MKQKFFLVLFVLFLFRVFIFGENIGNTDSFEKDFFNKIPSKSIVISNLDRLDALINAGNDTDLIKEETEYYSLILSLINELEDYKFYKINVEKEKQEVFDKINDLDSEDLNRVFSLDEFALLLAENKKASELFAEKKIKLAKLQYDAEILLKQIAREKELISKLRTKINKKETLVLEDEKKHAGSDKEDLLESVRELNKFVSIKGKKIQAYNLKLELVNKSIELGKIDIETFNDLKNYTNSFVSASRKNVLVTLDEIELKRENLFEDKKLYLDKVKGLDVNIVKSMKKQSEEKAKRAQLYEQIKVETNKDALVRLESEYELALYNINYLETFIELQEMKKYYFKLQYETLESRFNYLELYALQNLKRLSVKELNLKSVEASSRLKDLMKIRQMSSMTNKSLKASINSMTEMIEDFKSQQVLIAYRDLKQVNFLKIKALGDEIVLKEDYLVFLSDFLKVINENESSLENVVSFIEKEVGIKKFFVFEKKIFTAEDFFVLFSLIVLTFLLWIFRRRYARFRRIPFLRFLFGKIYIFFPALSLVFFVLSLLGLNNLYLFLYRSSFFSVIIVCFAVFIIGYLGDFITRFELNKKNRQEGSKENLSLVFILIVSGVRYFFILISIFLLFFIWTQPFHFLSFLFKFFKLDPKNLAALLVEKSFKLLFVFGLGFLIVSISKFIGNKIFSLLEDENRLEVSEKEARTKTLINVANNLIKVIVVAFIAFTALQELGFNITALLTGAGILGLAIGFGAQSLVKDFISGFFILMENQYAVGDVVKICDTAGLVEKITLRITVLRNLEGIVHIIPNGNITTVSNMTHEWSRTVLDISVAYKENVDKVIGVLKEVSEEFYEDQEWKKLLLKMPEVLGVDKLGDSGVIIKLLAETKPIKQWDVMRELNRRIKNKFDEAGIEIPFPHMKVVLDK